MIMYLCLVDSNGNNRLATIKSLALIGSNPVRSKGSNPIKQ